MQTVGATCNECFKTGHFQIVCGSLGRLPKKVQKPNSTDVKAAHFISVQEPVGFYNEQGNWVAEPPRPSPSIQTVHSLSVVQPASVIQDIQDIHPEANPETSLMQGMAKSQIFLSENSKTFNFSRDAVAPRSGSNLQAFPTEKQPIWQISTNSSSSHVLQASKRSPRDQDIQNSTEVSVQSFRDTETDPETTNADTGDSKKFQVSNFRKDLQRKGDDIVLSLPIDSTQFQQFCKRLNNKELFQCRDLLEKEIYGK